MVRFDSVGTRRRGGSAQPHCPHAPTCVGCPYFGTPYGEQLGRKQARVERAFADHAPSLSVQVEKPVGSAKLFGYRNQVKLVARRIRGKVVLGVYKPGTHDVVDAARCPVHDTLIERALQVVIRVADDEGVPIYDERTRVGWLRYVMIRSSWLRRTTQIVPVVNDRSWSGESGFIRRLQKARGVGSVVLNVNNTLGNTILSEHFIACTRHDALMERVGSLRFKFRPGSFIQANLRAARRAYAKVCELAALGSDDIAVDLYCGVGLISLHLACSGARVHGVEYSRAALRDASENLKVNGIHNARFRAGAADQVFGDVVSDLPRLDVVTLNPPRKGAAFELLKKIAAAAPSRIVYMSCNPETLARDVQILSHRGYRAERVYPFDFLPQSDHIECVTLLQRIREATGE